MSTTVKYTSKHVWLPNPKFQNAKLISQVQTLILDIQPYELLTGFA